MAANASYDTNVDFRVAFAQAVKNNPALLALFVAEGGLPRDLDAIVKHGTDATALNSLQGCAGSASAAATLALARAWVTLQDEYKRIMGIVQAVNDELAENPANAELCAELTGILKNETEVTIVEVERIDEKGNKVKEARKRTSVPAIRSEIESDLTRLEAATGAHEALLERQVPKERITRNRKAAQDLKGKLTDTVVSKAKRKAATGEESAAVRRMRRKYAAVFRILGRAAKGNKELTDLLAAASRQGRK